MKSTACEPLIVQEPTKTPKPSDISITEQNAPFDIDSLLNRCMGNQKFLEKILNKFEANAVKCLKDIEDSIVAVDAELLGSRTTA